MNEILILLQIILMGTILYLVYQNSRSLKGRKVVIEKENTKEMNKLVRMRNIKLTEPLTEKSRPSDLEEVVGQEEGIKALRAALCGPNPQHVIVYGPPGVGKTAAARLVLDEAIKKIHSPFNKESKFIEIDATTIRFDDRGIADPLIGSVHDPIYQGAGALGIAGIPQPKPGAVTKAHGGVLFIDEIGELHPIELNKLLKVLEDRKVFLDSSYYSSEDPNMPTYIREIFEKGLPADFRLIGATTRSPEEIAPAIRSRCVEIYFKSLDETDIQKIATNALDKMDLSIEDGGLEVISSYCSNGREVINLLQLCAGIAIDRGRDLILREDINWVIQNGRYSKCISNRVRDEGGIGIVNGLAVYGASSGILMPIEVTAIKVQEGKGEIKITGVVEEEEIKSSNRVIKRKSTALSSVENVLTMLNREHNLDSTSFKIHINIPGGVPVDGPSAGVTFAVAIYSALEGLVVDSKVAMTGEISLYGEVRPIGGVKAKIEAAIKAGVKKVIIPEENWCETLEKYNRDIMIFRVKKFSEVVDLLWEKIKGKDVEILSAERVDI